MRNKQCLTAKRHTVNHKCCLGQSGFPALWEAPAPSPSLQVQEGERPNRLDPQNPAYAEETGPSVIVNGFSERPRASHSQRIRPNSENLARSRPRSVPVRLALVNSHQIHSLVSVGDSIPRSTDFVFHVPPPSAPPPDLGGLNPLLQCGPPTA